MDCLEKLSMRIGYSKTYGWQLLTIPRGKIMLLVTEQEEANAAKQRPRQRSCAVSIKDTWRMRLAELRVVVNN